MRFDAIVLAGGRSRRLGGTAKSELELDGRTLLQRTIEAVSDANRIVVVGPTPTATLPSRVQLVREEPPFAGPAAAVAAGLDALDDRDAPNDRDALNDRDSPDKGTSPNDKDATAPDGTPPVLVLACDMPHVADVLAALTATPPPAPTTPTTGATAPPHAHGAQHPPAVIAQDADGRLQPLAALYPASELRDAVTRHRGGLEGLSMFALIDGIRLAPVTVGAGATDDVDTWEDASRLGVRRHSDAEKGGRP